MPLIFCVVSDTVRFWAGITLMMFLSRVWVDASPKDSVKILILVVCLVNVLANASEWFRTRPRPPLSCTKAPERDMELEKALFFDISLVKVDESARESDKTLNLVVSLERRESVRVREWDRLVIFAPPFTNWSVNAMLCASVLSRVVSFV